MEPGLRNTTDGHCHAASSPPFLFLLRIVGHGVGSVSPLRNIFSSEGLSRARVEPVLGKKEVSLANLVLIVVPLLTLSLHLPLS